MNIYDTKVISCSKCQKDIGEIDFDAVIFYPFCRECSAISITKTPKLFQNYNEGKVWRKIPLVS